MALKRGKTPNLLLGSGYYLISTKGPVGAIVLDTAEGVIDFAVNKDVATELRDVLNDFLAGKPSKGQGPIPGDK
jgi:hypothetical protein